MRGNETMSADLVREHADLVEQLNGTGRVYSVTWRAGDTPERRAWLIDHHAAVIEELRRRGRDPRGTVLRDEVDVEQAIGIDDMAAEGFVAAGSARNVWKNHPARRAPPMGPTQ